jgi:hypothetical protein
VWKVRLRTRDLLRVMNCTRRRSPKAARPRLAAPTLVTGRSRHEFRHGHGPLPRRSLAAASPLHRLCTSPAPPLYLLCTSSALLCTSGVQCNLCRLHGKVMSMGVASCLQACSGRPPRPTAPHTDTRGHPAPPGRPIGRTFGRLFCAGAARQGWLGR